MSAEQAAAVGTDREYETIYILRPDVERQKAADVHSRMSDVIAKGGGKLTRVENWGRRLLAYPVQRHKRGVYVYLKYLGAGELVSELERNLRMLDSVIKFQTVKLADALHAPDVSVSEDELRFEDVEPLTEDEEDISLARSLGLEVDEEPEPEKEPSEGDDGAQASSGEGTDGDAKKPAEQGDKAESAEPAKAEGEKKEGE